MPPVKMVTKEMVDGFAKVWNYKGLAVPFDDAHKQFAVDFCNMIFTSFFEQQAKALLAAKAKLATEENNKKIMLVEA